METKVVTQLAQLILARRSCWVSGNDEWFHKHTETIESMIRDVFPSGSGVDNGTKIDLDKSMADRIVLTFGYHHMDDGGGYDGWTEHTAIIRPSLAFGFDLKITGRDRKQSDEVVDDNIHANEYEFTADGERS